MCCIVYPQFNLNKIKKVTSKVERTVKSNKKKVAQVKKMTTKTSNNGPCDSKLQSLKRTLNKLDKLADTGKKNTTAFSSALSVAQRHLGSIKSRCPDLDISSEEAKLKSLSSGLEGYTKPAADPAKKMREGKYNPKIDGLVPNTHPAYNDFYRARIDLLTTAFENYKHGKATRSFKLMNEAKQKFNKIASEHSDLDLSLVTSELNRLEKLLGNESGKEIATTLKKEADANYFRNLVMNIPYIYSKGPNGARGAKGLKDFTGDWVYKTEEMFKDFTVDGFKEEVNAAKKNGTYPRVQFYAEQFQKVLDDYPTFITKSNQMFRTYLDYLNDVSVKENPQKEIEQLKRTQKFCELLLKFAPNNPTASQWLKEVTSNINKTGNSLSYSSAMHKKHLGKMLFSKKVVAIGNEKESDFTQQFSSGDYIYATVYLPTKVRKQTDSYAMNDLTVSINGGIVSNPRNTAVWVTTPMQEKNYLQFAIVPDKSWLTKHEKDYLENDIRTFEHTLYGLVNAGPYSNTKVTIKLSFKRGVTVENSFTIDLSTGLAPIEKMLSRQENERLKSVRLPKAGMSNASLENQALSIMRKKSAGSKTYYKAIITSPNWDYDKSYAGVVVSRSIVIALVSKEHDGKCMYQYLNFKQQAQGNGKFNNNLEFAGAGTNVYMSCDNIK